MRDRKEGEQEKGKIQKKGREGRQDGWMGGRKGENSLWQDESLCVLPMKTKGKRTRLTAWRSGAAIIAEE